MKKFVKWVVVVGVVAAFLVPSASAASPTMAQFKALKATVATLKSQLATTRATVKVLKAEDAWWNSCVGYYDVDQYDGYDFMSYTYTTALDISSDASTAAKFAAFYPECLATSSSTSYRSSGTQSASPAVSPVELAWPSKLTKHP